MTPDTEIVFTVIESPAGGFEASAVGHSIHTQAESLAELRAALQDAVRCHFEEVDRPSLAAILTDVAAYLEIDREDLSDQLF